MAKTTSLGLAPDLTTQVATGLDPDLSAEETPRLAPNLLDTNDLAPNLLESAENLEEAEVDAEWDDLISDEEEEAETPTPVEQPAQQKQIGIGMDLPLPSMEDAFTFAREFTIKSVLGGIRDASQETIETVADYFNWAGDAALDPGIKGIMAQAFIPGALEGALIQKGDPSVDIGETVKGALPEVDQPTTAAGKMARGITQFLTGMMGPMRVLKGAGIGTIASSTIAGAFADGTAFDPHEKNLANLIQENTDLLKPVTDFLAVQKDDSDAMARIKKVIEGAGMGLVVDGFIKTLRIIKAARTAKGTKIPTDELYGTAPLADDAFGPLGNPGKPLMEAVEVDDAMLTRLRNAEREASKIPVTPQGRASLITEKADVVEALPPGVFIEADEGRGLFVNLAKINAPEDIQAVIKTTADLLKEPIDVARGGEKVTRKEMEKLADSMGFTVEDLLSRREGVPMTRSETIASRKLWIASGANMRKLAAKAADPATSSNLDLFNFRRGMAVHHAIQKEVFAARTEQARALNAWAIPVGSGEEQARAVTAMMDTYGGDMLSRKFAQRIASADKAGLLDDAALGKLVEKGALARTYDGFLEAWVNGLLSGPKTHLVNMMSNTMVIAQSIAERATAGQINKLTGDVDGVVAGEAMAQMVGVVEGLKDVWKTLGKHGRMTVAKVKGDKATVAEIEKGIRMPAPGLDLTKIDLPVKQAITAENVGLRSGTFKDPKNWLGNGVDGFGAAIRLPGKALNVEDQFFKTLGYRMELHSQAFRAATKEGLTGKELNKRMWEIIENPPKDIRMESVDAALYQTFTNNLGEMGRGFSQLVNKVPGGRIIFPFIRTPANIFKYTFADRTPLGLLSSKIRGEIAEGGAKGQMAKTRMAMGTMTMLTMMDLVYGGHITGSGPPGDKSRDARKRQKIENDSIRIGDRYFSYSRTDPMGATIGTAARIAEFVQWAAKEQDDVTEMEEIVVAGITAMSEVMINKTYMQGMSNLVEAINDPKRYGMAYVERLAGSLIPAGVAEVSRFKDPYMKEVDGLLEAMKARTPGWSKDLPNVRDVWGREITYRSGMGWMFDAMSPIYSRRENPTAIDSEMVRLKMDVSKPQRAISYGLGLDVNLDHFPRIYDRYVELAGGALPDPVTGLGAFDTLNDIVDGNHDFSEIYFTQTDGPEGGKAQSIRGIMSRFRQMSRERLLLDFPELLDIVETKRIEQIEAQELAQ